MSNFTGKYTVFSTKMGWMGFVSSTRGIYAAILPRRTRSDAELELLKRCPGKPEPDIASFESLVGQVGQYLNGEDVDFTCRIDWSWATDFQKRILQHVMAIPRGMVLTYGEVAALAGSPLAARAAGRALAANNIPLIIPCHRVVQRNGQLGGFTGAGVELKARLLNLEGMSQYKPK